jgi:hypothetical protein
MGGSAERGALEKGMDAVQVRKVIWKLFKLMPTPEAAMAADVEAIRALIEPLGLAPKRAPMLKRFSQEYLQKQVGGDTVLLPDCSFSEGSAVNFARMRCIMLLLASHYLGMLPVQGDLSLFRPPAIPQITWKIYRGLRCMAICMLNAPCVHCLQWHEPEELHGIGQYGADAYRIFCRGDWRGVAPRDKDLLRYHSWLAGTDGQGTGLARDVAPLLDE